MMRAREVRARARELVNRLEEWRRREERGVLARLRRGLSETTRPEAWTVLGPYFGPIAVDNRLYETVAGCFALHPVFAAADIGNFGETMRRVMVKMMGGEREREKRMRDEKEPHARFRRLLACGSRDEICQHVRHAVRLAKSKEVPVNYPELFVDLWWREWKDRSKVRWAKAYWKVRPASAGFSLAGAGTPVDEEPGSSPE